MVKPWHLQDKLKKESVPGINDLLIMADRLESPRDKALLMLTYLTAGRICEIVRYNRKGIQHLSIKRKDLIVTEKNNRKTLLITVRNEKNRQRKNKQLPIPLDKEENIIVLEPVKDYIKDLDLDEELFPFGYKNALKILHKVGLNPHFLRHIRLTHLVTLYDFNEQELRMYAGWTDGRPAKHYIELRWGDLLKKL